MKLYMTTSLFNTVTAIFATISQGTAVSANFHSSTPIRSRRTRANDETGTPKIGSLIEIHNTKGYKSSDDDIIVAACFIDAHNQVYGTSKLDLVGLEIQKEFDIREEDSGTDDVEYTRYIDYDYKCRRCDGEWYNDRNGGDVFSPLLIEGGEKEEDLHQELEDTLCDMLRRTGLPNFETACDCIVSYIYRPYH